MVWAQSATQGYFRARRITQRERKMSRWDQEEGGELDSHEDFRLSFAGLGEIKRREVELDPQESPEEIKSREVELGSESWTSSVSVYYSTSVLRILSLWLCSAQHLKQQLRSTLVATQWRGDTALTFSVVLAAVHGLLGLPGRSAVEPSLFLLFYPSPHPPPSPVPVPNKPSRFC